MDRLTYHSKDIRFKSPYGAVPSGTAVSFTLRPPRSAGYASGTISARFEFLDNEIRTLPLEWSGMELDRDLFTGKLETADYVGLVWYSFTLTTPDGREETSEEYQLTVYDDSETVPDWYGQGMTYQIFPDRFYRTRVPSPEGMVGGRTVHKNWEDAPVYRPNEKGEVRNRDFFGGNLKGIIEKLPYLQELGVETIYFNPIFEAAENHRYGTADYEKIDPMLGSEKDFKSLCKKAHDMGMRVMLDGVFNHTGFVSKYFNGDGFYPTLGAAQSKDSPYYDWFTFTNWPGKYEAWWGIYSLPAVKEGHPDYLDYIIRGEDSIVRRWLKAGADGWRLDVADELPDSFVHELHKAVRETKPDGVVIGEVWEDGTTKIAYDVRRRHLLGGHLDGLMNYPLRTALLDYLLGGDAGVFMEKMEQLRENYPPFAFYSAMNALGTHDTLRVLTLLGVGRDCLEQTKDWRAEYVMSEEELSRGIQRLKVGATLLYAFPGSPMVYYGDEVGMTGFEDPFNRYTYPWGKENQELLSHFKALGKARKELTALRKGDIRYVAAEGPVLAFTRTWEKQTVLAAANLGTEPYTLTVGRKKVKLAPMSAELLEL